MTNFRQIFENDWCGIEYFLKKILSPIFGDYEQGYDILTNDPKVREKAENAKMLEELKALKAQLESTKENNEVAAETAVTSEGTEEITQTANLETTTEDTGA